MFQCFNSALHERLANPEMQSDVNDSADKGSEFTQRSEFTPRSEFTHQESDSGDPTSIDNTGNKVNPTVPVGNISAENPCDVVATNGIFGGKTNGIFAMQSSKLRSSWRDSLLPVMDGFAQDPSIYVQVITLEQFIR